MINNHKPNTYRKHILTQLFLPQSSRCVDSENMEIVRNDFVKIPVTKNDISIIKWGFESSIPKKKL